MYFSLLHYIVTIVIIFISIYSCGIGILKYLKFEGESDSFFIVLTGYVFVGIISLSVHFFFPINNFFSLAIFLISILFCLQNFKKIFQKEIISLLIVIVFCGLLLLAYSDHPIDTNMYHHPYVSYLKSEKIIFGLANIEFRFGHISFLQYVQAAYTNSFLHKTSLASINIILYLSFIFVVSKKVISSKNFDYIFLVRLFLLSFFLLKLNRYREFGNDLIPLLVSCYFFIKILKEIYVPSVFSKILINLSPIFFVFMFSHKITYIFAVLMFLCLINFKNFNFIKIINGYFLFFSLVFLAMWLLKNYITTSCLVYPAAISCFDNNLFEMFGLAKPSAVARLSELWAKAFIAHPNWKEIDLDQYMEGFNWFPTWFGSHFIKILEILSPLFVAFLYVWSGFFFYREKVIFIPIKNEIKYGIYYLLSFILVGLGFWFYKAPIFRYGVFFVISFLILSNIIIFNQFFYTKKFYNLNYFKTLLIFSLFFFIAKNTVRIYRSVLFFFPKTVINVDDKKFSRFYKNGLLLLKPKNDVCYYTINICSHELPSAMKIKKLGDYYVFSN